ncbi:FIST C-terminal domain-containing protein [Neiella sp. HB171785]|uniref:FIST C-terminal domain-containing protein n=1 Tax=Neiella litorisoli TaxID=2771431 RepID=A0A8J6UMD6_9GAMM|nr:FIST N-terminal domain-containing protein [Neiella litorisoli]MBD1390615.1 FIST C-terminal domain-containing protein [Neiella litorisoli]
MQRNRMHIKTAQSALSVAHLAVTEVVTLLADEAADFIVIAGSPAEHFNRCAELLQQHYPEATIVGCSSFGGVLSDQGHCVAESGASFAAWLLNDPNGSYGVALQTFTNSDPEQVAKQALDDALNAANRCGELPALIWMHSTPGHEEQILAALEQELGGSVPVIGGAAAPNLGNGAFSVFGASQSSSAGLALAVLFPSGRIGYSFHSGCAMEKPLGTVTKAEGRLVQEIDGRPALQVYQHAVGLPIQQAIEQQCWTQIPVGRVIGEHQNMPVFSLALPVQVIDQSIEFLATFSTGEPIYLMRGTEQSLRGRSKRVLASAKQMTPEGRLGGQAAGALVVYCACCKQVVASDLDEVHRSMAGELGSDTPFITLFTYGEQGPLLESKNIHGNLMIAALVFYTAGD